MHEFETLTPIKTCQASLESGKPIIIQDVAEVARTSPQEYPFYKRMDAKSVVAVP